MDLTVEVPLKAHIMGFTSAEVPVTWHGRERKQGKAQALGERHEIGKTLA